MINYEEFEDFLKKLPKLDEELNTFAADLEDIWKDQPLMAIGFYWSNYRHSPPFFSHGWDAPTLYAPIRA
jgi:hypothetical protein